MAELISWTLDDREELHREAPATFWIPARERRESLREGEIVKLLFRIELRDTETGEEYAEVERMWVTVTGRIRSGYRGEQRPVLHDRPPERRAGRLRGAARHSDLRGKHRLTVR